MARRPVVAGMFYPAAGEALRQALSGLFAAAEAANRKPRTSPFRIVVSPHAGYEYSGRTAAFAISSLKPAKAFIVLGPNHNVLGPEFSIMTSGEWATPLGKAKINAQLARELAECDALEEDELAHAHEHSVEVQLPFLQHRFKDFGFVPISITNTGYSDDFLGKCVSLGRRIAAVMRRKPVGLIASSDFSHYVPANIADGKDSEAMDKILKLDARGFFRTLERTEGSVCGYGPVAAAMAAAKAMGMKGAKVISHSTSGDATGDYSSVVSYYAIGFA